MNNRLQLLLNSDHTFVEIDHEIFSTVILSLPLIQEGQLSVSGERMCTILVNRLEDQACPVNVWLGKLTALDITHWVDWAVKPQHKQTNSDHNMLRYQGHRITTHTSDITFRTSRTFQSLKSTSKG